MTASPQDLSELVTQLDSDQMNHRTEARNSIQQLLTNSTAPTADANVRRVLEEEALQILQSDLSHSAQVWLLRMLELAPIRSVFESGALLGIRLPGLAPGLDMA